MRKLATASGKISIWLDRYDDLFSDFDPRPYSDRTLSDDFIREAKKVARECNAPVPTLVLLLPENQRQEHYETMIVKRLHNHFSYARGQLSKERRKINFKGILYTCTGVVLMIVAGYISFLRPELYVMHILLILFEPAGWFLVWMGLDHLVYFSKRSRKESDFYAKMARAKIEFDRY